jgi:hypothetical protein
MDSVINALNCRAHASATCLFARSRFRIADLHRTRRTLDHSSRRGLDVNPKAGARTGALGLTCRVLSGLFVGWWAAVPSGISPVLGAIVGAIGAILGAYGSFLVRRRCIPLIGNVPSGLLEDIVAIAASIAIVAKL